MILICHIKQCIFILRAKTYKTKKKTRTWQRYLYFIHEMKYKSLTQIENVTIVDSKNRNVKENFVTSLQTRTKRQLCIMVT